MMNRSKTIAGLASVAALLLASCAHPAASPSAPGAAAEQGQRVQRAALAKGLYEVAYSARQDAVFVASSGGFGDDAGPSRILRLNPQTLAVEREIPLDRKAFGLALDDAGGRLYVGNTVDLSVTVVDVAENRVVGVVQLEEKVKGKDGALAYPRDLRQVIVDPATRRLFLQGHSDDSVLYVVNTDTLKVDKIIPGLGGPKAPGLAFDRAGHRLFVTNLRGELITIDTRTLTIAKRVDIPAEQPLNIAFDPSSKRLFVTDQGLEMIRKYQASSIPGFQSKHPGNRVVVFDADSGRQLHAIPTDAGPMGILLDARRQRLYVTNRAAGNVGIYDSRSYAPIGTIALPTHPNSLALDPQRNVLYVTIKNGEGDAEGANESVARIQL